MQDETWNEEVLDHNWLLDVYSYIAQLESSSHSILEYEL